LTVSTIEFDLKATRPRSLQISSIDYHPSVERDGAEVARYSDRVGRPESRSPVARPPLPGCLLSNEQSVTLRMLTGWAGRPLGHDLRRDRLSPRAGHGHWTCCPPAAVG